MDIYGNFKKKNVIVECNDVNAYQLYYNQYRSVVCLMGNYFELQKFYFIISAIFTTMNIIIN